MRWPPEGSDLCFCLHHYAGSGRFPRAGCGPRSAPGDFSAHPLGTALSVVGLKDPLSHKQPPGEKKHRRCSKSSWQTSECRAGMASQVSGMQKGTGDQGQCHRCSHLHKALKTLLALRISGQTNVLLHHESCVFQVCDCLSK